MVNLYALCIMILAIGGLSIIVILPNATWSVSQSSVPGFIEKGILDKKGLFDKGKDIGTAAGGINCSVMECWGTAANDIMTGDNGNNKMFGLGGDDVLQGRSGDDSMVGHQGVDRINGNEGNDQLWGESDNDVISGDEGNDYIVGGSGNDDLAGGPGVDTIWGLEGNDVIYHYYPSYGESSDGSGDTIYCGEGYDKVFYNRSHGDLAYDCEQVFPPSPINKPPPPINKPSPRGNEDCDRAGMPGCPE